MRLTLLTAGLLLTALLPAPPAFAQDTTAAPPGPRRGVTDRVELEGFLDGVMTTFLRVKHIAGATISVVKDGALFLAKGYGWADVDRRIPVDPERTLFRIGSISKLFTWTSVMQLVEQGKLDLNTDINTYLDFKIPDLHCDYYGASLHKWLSVPLGAGILYVKKERIAELWPVYGDPASDDDIHKLNHTGTHPCHNDLGIENAIAFHEAIGGARKEAELRAAFAALTGLGSLHR